jgi:phage FluMu gp28-like protein
MRELLPGIDANDIPHVWLPYQQRWCNSTAGLKSCVKSRRIGMSWADAGDSALVAAQTNGQNTYYMGYEKEMARTYIEDAASYAKFYDIAASEVEEDQEIWRDGDEDKSVNVFRLYFNSGYKVEALSGKPRNLRSRQGRVRIDEAAFHDFFKEVLEAALALRIWGGTIGIITTFNGIENPFYEFDQDILAGKEPYERHLVDFRQAVAEGLYQRICLIQGKTWTADDEQEWMAGVYSEFGDKASQELDCIPKRSGGRYFPTVLIEQCMGGNAPVLTYTCPDDFATRPQVERELHTDGWLATEVAPALQSGLTPSCKSFYGMDFARNGDLSVLNFSQIWENLTRATVLGVELRNVPFEQQRQILFWIVDRLPRFMAGAHDARGNGQYLAEVAMQRYGATRIHQIQLTRPWYADNFPRYKAGMEDRRVLLPASSDWTDDHRAVVVDKGTPLVPDGKNVGVDGGKRHGDSAIAGVLMWFASLHEGAEIEFEAVGQPRMGYELGDYVL